MPSWLEKLDLQRWWKVAIAVGVAIVVPAVSVKDQGFALIGLGVIALGFGEWMNHRMETQIKYSGTLTTFERVNRPMGLALDGVGIILIALGLFRIVVS
jgi:hypothetical protein